MKGLNNILVKGGFWGVAALLGVTACSDDHFDIQTAGPVGSKTIWQNIEEQPQLDSLAMILSRTVVMKDENDQKSVLTYAELLNQSQAFTVFAPLNGTYNAKQYIDLLNEADNLMATGTEESKAQALALKYMVSNQFAGNHIARFNYESNQSSQDVRMLNSKLCEYNAGEQVFNGVALSSDEYNASNGTMHVLNGQSPFRNNIYDFMENDLRFSNIYAYLSDPLIETREFSESQSTQGAMNENGEMIYVDSVYVTHNEVLDYCGALISNEDSLYIAMIPTNEAWNEAIEALKPYLNYGDEYGYDTQNRVVNNSYFGQTQAFTQEERDSLFEYNAKMMLAQSMFVNPSTFDGINTSDSAAVISHALSADSLIATNYVIYYNPTPGQQNPMFNPAEPTRASNGYIFPLEHFKTDPRYVWMSENEFSPLGSYMFGNNLANYSTISLTDANRNTEIEGADDVDYIVRFEKSGAMRLYFRMPSNLLSGEYKISAVMAPSAILLNYAESEEAQNEEIEFDATIETDYNQTMGQRVTGLTVSPEKVDTVVLWENFKFEKAYYGLPEEVSSFPVLCLSLSPRYRDCNALNIIQFIIEPARPNEDTTEGE